MAADAISHVHERSFADALIAESWLLADPEIKRRCRWVRRMPWLEERFEELLTGSPAQRVAVIRLLGATGISHERKLILLRRALAEGDPCVLRAIAWEAVTDEHENTTDLLAQLARQQDALTARVATRDLKRRRPEIEARTLPDSTKSTGQGSVSTSPGTSGVAPGTHPDWSALWNRFELLDPEQQAAAARQLRTRARDWLVPLRARLAAGQADIRLRALRIAKMLGLIKELDEQTYRLAHDPDATVRSFAVTLLTELPGATTLRILRDALHDPDERVQANAIAALDTLELGREAPNLEEKLDSPHNRVRANAVRALMRLEFAQAGATLLDMLEDDSSAHRISALWVVERLKLSALISRLDQMAQRDLRPAGADACPARPTWPARRTTDLELGAQASGIVRDLCRGRAPMTPILAQDHLNDTLRGLRDYLRVGGSLLTVGLVLIVIIGVVVLTYVLTRRQQQTQNPPVVNDPQLLFESLLGGLQLTAAQRGLLRTFAQESRPDQPALLLVSSSLFDQHLAEHRFAPPDGEAFARIREALFPQGEVPA